MKNDSRITLFISSLSSGGAERVTCNLANYLYKNGYKVDVITMANKNDTYVLDNGIKRICLLDEKERSSKIKDFLVRKKRLKDYVMKNQNVSCYIVMLPITIFILIRLKKLTKSKMIISERNNPRSYSLFKKILMKYSARRCDGLVVQTGEIASWYKNVRNIVIIPNAMNEDVVLPKREFVEKRFVAVGRLEKQKNYPMLIKAFAIFSAENPDYKLEIYGQGNEEKKLKQMIKKYNLSDKIIFMGYVKDISKRIVNAACFVMTSDYEGMPNALIEAMCIGIPCIATDSDGGGVRELIKNGENGIMVRKNAAAELAEKMMMVLDFEELSAKMIKNAIKMRKTLAMDVIYKKWIDFIKKIEVER